MTIAQFIARFPEFTNDDPVALQAALDDAAAMCPAAAWGALQSQGIALRTAQARALSPYARNLQLTSKDGGTVYDARLDALIRIVGSGGMVI